MRRAAILLLTAATLQAAAPTPEAMAHALAVAEDDWGYHVTEPIHLHAEALNACVLNRDDAAIITVLTKTSALIADDGTRTELPTTYEYVIRINSNCQWSQRFLNQVMSHEYGHVLRGAGYHSKDKKSIMYKITMPSGQSVMQADRAGVTPAP